MKITISSTRSKSFNKQIDFYDLFHLTLFKQVLHQMELMEPDCLESVVLIDRCRGLIRSKSQLFFNIFTVPMFLFIFLFLFFVFNR